MVLSGLDLTVFFGFIAAVLAVGFLMGRGEKSSEDYFLAGRGLKWWVIGFSLIAANISTEQFVGMSGQAAGSLGLAIASYEWMAAITLVVVAFVFLPMFLRSGIYTIPEFLEYRYNKLSRTLMAGFTMIIYVAVTIPAVIYSGALVCDTLFAGQKLMGVEINVVSASWIIGVLAAMYVAFGGLKACAWADLLQGSALIIGGFIVVVLALQMLGKTPVSELATTLGDEAVQSENLQDESSGLTKFFALNSNKLHMVLPKDNPDIPWTALVLGLWIPNFYYWGLNQYITQRTLGAHSLGEGQKGIVFAAALKLIIPFIIVVPGLIAFNIYSQDMVAEAEKDNAEIIEAFNEGSPAAGKVFPFDGDFAEQSPEVARSLALYHANQFSSAEGVKAIEQSSTPAELAAANDSNLSAINAAGVDTEAESKLIGYKYDSAFGLLIKKLTPEGLRGFMLAAILGAVMSSLASMLNSASTIFTMDIFSKFISRDASQSSLVGVGRLCVVAFTVIGCLISPVLGDPRFRGIFNYIQEFQGYISPGILAVFVFGILVKRAPAMAGVVGLLINPFLYGALAFGFPNMAFLDRMAVAFFCNLGVMAIMTMVNPLNEPKELPVNTTISLEPSAGAKTCGIVVVIITLILYAIFW
ncbi:sodium:solute symporter family transporter [Adhaeretor mobilis]|uniref:Sodium/glucose cotransporter n=1 Tax=Adhaeretor mobilis TaxID=1930276 RepID=A0A517MXT7_9BACT|nr:sodium/solute symporter [Adhaeretor mobilis]QDS99698.1 Sodium/glucose cotransporter [Adhaeretor mobilis]